MEKALVLKTFEMDYSFIIKNYLDPKLWQKTWTLFQYKNFIIQLNLDQILVRDEKIRFNVKCTNDYRKWTDDVFYSLKVNDISFLKRAINSAIFNCIKGLEMFYFIKDTDTYHELDALYDEEKDKLTDIAENFLTDVGVESNACREAYIEAYVDENSKCIEIRDDYVCSRKFMELTDLWLVWINSLQDEKRKDQWLELIQEQLTEEEWKKAYEEAIEYSKYMETEEFEKEMQNNLEDV